MCVRCGLKRRTVTTGKWDSHAWSPTSSQTINTTLETTPLSLWYREHFGTECAHEWSTGRFDFQLSLYSSFCGIRWRPLSEHGSGPYPRLTQLPPLDEAQLNALFEEDADRCSEFILRQLRDTESRPMAKPAHPTD